VDPYTTRVKRREKFWKTFLWAASILTIGILVSIIGFILFRGFVSDVKQEAGVIARGEDAFRVGENSGTSVAVIVNKRIRKHDFTMAELKELFVGAKTNWGMVSGQDIPVRIYAYGDVTEIGASFKYSVMQESSYRNIVRFVDADAQMIEKVANTKGGIGFISGENIEMTRRQGVKVVPVRTYAVVVNEEVLELRNNIKLRFINEDQLRRIFTGKVSNWKDVGGIDLPVHVVSFPQSEKITVEFQRLSLQEGEKIRSTITVHTFENLVQTLGTLEGAVGFCKYTDALQIKDQMLTLERRQVKPNLTPRFFVTPPKRAGVVGGVSTIIFNTLAMIVLTLLISAPIGVMAAIFLTEYAKQGTLVRLLRFGTETLAGIPSIIFGLFGFIIFVTLLELGIGLVSGTLTITMMILPTIIITAEEAIKAVPMSYREGSLALGATKWQTIVRSVIPPAAPGIMTGIILAIGRAVGKTAALLFTMGTDYRMVKNLSSSARTLSVHLYILVKEGISFERAFATGTILIAVILIVNFTTNKLIGKMSSMGEIHM
jgi:phosphate transport system permease protein